MIWLSFTGCGRQFARQVSVSEQNTTQDQALSWIVAGLPRGKGRFDDSLGNRMDDRFEWPGFQFWTSNNAILASRQSVSESVLDEKSNVK
jgi:hypothetical protein